VERLPEKLRLVVVLGVYEGFDYETIGRVAGIPVGTVKSRMHLAVQRLKEWLNNENAPDARS
jgi:RNA polymerase sigma-70 factor (ECF subfamily)